MYTVIMAIFVLCRGYQNRKQSSRNCGNDTHRGGGNVDSSWSKTYIRHITAKLISENQLGFEDCDSFVIVIATVYFLNLYIWSMSIVWLSVYVVGAIKTGNIQSEITTSGMDIAVGLQCCRNEGKNQWLLCCILYKT